MKCGGEVMTSRYWQRIDTNGNRVKQYVVVASLLESSLVTVEMLQSMTRFYGLGRDDVVLNMTADRSLQRSATTLIS